MSAYTSQPVRGWGATQSCAYCHGFAKIPPLIRGSDGKMYGNPDFEMIRRFTVRAEPFGQVLAPGAAFDFSITVPAEQESLGDLLINELMAVFTPDTVQSISIEILSSQTSRTFQNAPIWNTLILGNAHLNCCLPCCTLVQATQSLLVRVTNNEAIPVAIRIVARGKRFVPKSEELRARMLMYWNSIPTYPYYLTLDNQQEAVAAGATVDALMTVQGTGDFEIKWARCEVLPDGGAAPAVNDIVCTLTEQVGRQLQSDPLELGAFVATPTLAVAGFPGGLFRAASACHCPPVSQLLKRNTKLRVRFTNQGGNNAIVRLTFAGCFHQVGECPPGRSTDRIRSLEPTIGPLLIPQRDYCPPVAQQDVTPAAPAYATGAVRVNGGGQAGATGGGLLQVPLPPGSGGGSRTSTGPFAYLDKYYERAPGGGVRAIHGAAHGLVGPHAARRGLQGMSGVTLQPGQVYWDPHSKQWRRA